MQTTTATSYVPHAAPPTLARIMVPMDGSSFSERAIPAAESIARRTGALLHFVRVNEPLLPGGLPAPEYWREEVTREALDSLELCAGHARESGLETSVSLLDGSPVQALCAEALRSGADLVVMSTHGRTGVQRAWLGSVADGVARHTDTPLLLLRPNDALDPREHALELERILVGLDGSRMAESVLPLAGTLAHAFDAHLTLLRVVRPVAVPILDMPLAPPAVMDDPQQTETAVREAQLYLEDVALRLSASGLHVEQRVTVAGDIPHEVAREADDARADLVALASHGRGASRLFFGSVTDAVLRGARGAILIARADS
jgi:nucleotide-binding universal stress UspA family protein